MTIEIRAARGEDADAIADVWLAAFKATYSFPPAHPDEDVRRWIREQLVPGEETFVAVDETDEVVAVMALGGEDLDQLYVRPGHFDRGIGSRLVDLAKERRPNGLGLYTFQANDRARRFYERRGFRAVWFGDGEANEERQPDVRYEWRPGE